MNPGDIFRPIENRWLFAEPQPWSSNVRCIGMMKRNDVTLVIAVGPGRQLFVLSGLVPQIGWVDYDREHT